MAAAEAAAQAAADLMAAEEAAAQAAAQAAADLMAAEEAAAQAAAEKKALEDELAGVPKTIEELEAALMVASDALTAAAEAQAAADTALADATAARMAAQAAVDTSDAAGLADAIVALQAARAAEGAAEVAAMAAAEVATAAGADVVAAQAALTATDTGPASETLTERAQTDATAGARTAFELLSSIPRLAAEATDDDDAITALPRRTTVATPSAKHDGTAVTFSVPGWKAGSSPGTLKRTASGVTSTGMVYSNIEAPKYKLFAVVYGKQAAVATATNWKKANIPAANPYIGGTDQGSIAGTYDSAAGTFTCDGGTDGACPPNAGFPERRRDGTVIDSTDLIGTWTFKPTEEAAMVKVPDVDFLTYGFWLSKTTADGPVGFGVWYDGSAKTIASIMEINELDEKVTYTGSAAGKYVTKDEVLNTAQAGYFTADAVLTADFTDDDSTDNDIADTLKGTISGFKDGDSAPLGDLKLTLSGELSYDEDVSTLTVDVPDAGELAGDDATNTITAQTGAIKHGKVGNWEAQLFGKDKTTNIPTGVAGAFDAEIPNQGVVVGGFGATK